MTDPLYFQVELVEKEIVSIELVEKELLSVNLKTLDLIPRKTYIWELEDIVVINKQNLQVLVYNASLKAWENKYLTELLAEYLIENETPTEITSIRFQTANSYILGTLNVFLNGQKIHDSEITKVSDTLFEYPLDIIAGDKVEVRYIKQP